MTRWNTGREWILERLTRRRAWVAIAFIVIWNLVVGGVLVRQMLADDLPIATVVVPQVIIVIVLAVATSVWLLRHSRSSEDR